MFVIFFKIFFFFLGQSKVNVTFGFSEDEPCIKVPKSHFTNEENAALDQVYVSFIEINQLLTGEI